jgi:hypothetical protein
MRSLAAPCASGVAEFGVPVAAASLGGQIEQVPERFERVAVARVLTGLGGRVKEFRSPEVPDHLAVER